MVRSCVLPSSTSNFPTYRGVGERGGSKSFKVRSNLNFINSAIASAADRVAMGRGGRFSHFSDLWKEGDGNKKCAAQSRSHYLYCTGVIGQG